MFRSALFSLIPVLALAACTSDGRTGDQADLGFDSVGDVIDGEFLIQDDLTSREMEQLGIEQLDWNDALGIGLYEATDGSVSVSALQRALQTSGRGAGTVESNRPRTMSSVNDPYATYQWDMAKMDVQTAWTKSKGAGVRVAVIDTGLYTSGEDKPIHVAAGYDFVDNDSSPNDLNGHGTHVSGTIAQATNNGKGCIGVAPDAEIMPVRVLDANGSGSSWAIVSGITWAADHGAKVINMSLGSPYSSDSEKQAIDYAVSKGVVIVAASGNEYATSVGYPAAYDGVIAVGATRFDGAVSAYSNGGTKLDLVAPGGDMSVDQDNNGYGDGILQETVQSSRKTYQFFEGTSMASPHVAGVAALLLAAGAQPSAVEGLMESTAKDVGTTGWDSRSGWGQVRPVEALAKLASGGSSGGGSGGGSTTPPASTDTTPPVISNVTGTRSGTSLTIAWTTNEPASSYVTFQTYGTFGDAALVTNHSSRFTISSTGTYYFTVESDDAAGNSATDGQWVTRP